MDLKDRIFEILKRPQLASLATVTQEGKPWVRYVMVAATEDLIIRCATFINARKTAHIKDNPEVHITCGVTDPRTVSPYVQIQARAALTTGHQARHAFWSDKLSSIFTGPDDPRYGVIEIVPYRIEYCTPGSHEPEVWTASTLGTCE